ncbi:methyltransferase domain-containing protein [Streptomyces chartreusis]|uniref:methyltransferase domain-containing protein n=1 Tax=Streptomyces chartreusis TaxID=1969 RepID=UPI0036C8FBF4
MLDVGGGPGRLVAALSARGRTVLGIDVSETAVQHAVMLGARHCGGPSSTACPARVTGALSY